jgi:hypothetical protein
MNARPLVGWGSRSTYLYRGSMDALSKTPIPLLSPNFAYEGLCNAAGLPRANASRAPPRFSGRG